MSSDASGDKEAPPSSLSGFAHPRGKPDRLLGPEIRKILDYLAQPTQNCELDHRLD